MTIADFRRVLAVAQQAVKESDIVNVAKRKRETTTELCLKYTVALCGVLLQKLVQRKEFDFGNYRA